MQSRHLSTSYVKHAISGAHERWYGTRLGDYVPFTLHLMLGRNLVGSHANRLACAA